jgi:hypothetical protein
MAQIRLAIIGCGGMGHRHLYGLTELQRAGVYARWQKEMAATFAATAEDAAYFATPDAEKHLATLAEKQALPLHIEAVDIRSGRRRSSPPHLPRAAVVVRSATAREGGCCWQATCVFPTYRPQYTIRGLR